MIEEKYYGGIVGMAQKKLKVGIIGCGGIANGKHMPGLAKLDTVEMVAFCDTIEERAVRSQAIRDGRSQDLHRLSRTPQG